MAHPFRKELHQGRWGCLRMASAAGVSKTIIHAWLTEGIVPDSEPAGNERQFFLILACAMLSQTGGRRAHMRAAVRLFLEENAPASRWGKLVLVRQGDELFWLGSEEDVEAWLAWDSYLLPQPFAMMPVGRCWSAAHAELSAMRARRRAKRSQPEHLEEER